MADQENVPIFLYTFTPFCAVYICDPSREKGRVGCHIVKFTFSAFYDESRNINMLVGS